jgi:hypothetical protein
MKVDGRLEPRHFRGDSLAVGLITAAGNLDVVLRPRGFEEGYSALAPRAITVEVGGTKVVVGALADLIASKDLLDREKDREHLPELRRLASSYRPDLGWDADDEPDINRTRPDPPELEL